MNLTWRKPSCPVCDPQRALERALRNGDIEGARAAMRAIRGSETR